MGSSTKKLLLVILTICCCLIKANHYCQIDSPSSIHSTLSAWIPILQAPKDEFNSTESPQFTESLREGVLTNSKHSLVSLKQILLRSTYQECCLPWKNLTTTQEIQDELRRKNGKGKTTLKSVDLLHEIKRTFANITYLSIDGQPGESEREKYYNFYDGVHYYLRLLKVAHSYMDDQMLIDSGGSAPIHETDFNRLFKRQLKSIEFRVAQDPILSSFIEELTQQHLGSSNPKEETTTINIKFDFYEDFLRYTQFGHYYARNISMIRESVLVFDQICSHLTSTAFPSNLTRPSKQYEMIRRMSYELYFIRNELLQQISNRIRNNRQDVRRIFAKLDDLTQTKPYIRMLGDEFSSSSPASDFSDHVHKLTHLLDLYMNNSLTEVSFYDQLSELPEDFIVLGSSIAHDYENKEIPQYSRFDADDFNWPSSAYRTYTNRNSSTSEPTDARQSNISLLTRLFS